MISKISELKAGQKNVYVTDVNVVKTEEIIEKEINGKKVKICSGIVKDGSGEIKISAFGFASQFLYGSSRIEIQNCYVKEYNGELEISTGYFGRIKRIELIKEENE